MSISGLKITLAATAALSLLSLTGCQSGSSASSGSSSSAGSSTTSATTGGQTAGEQTTQPAAGTAPGQSANGAVNLTVTSALRQNLMEAYWTAQHTNHPKETKAHLIVPTGVYYGKVGTTYYALGTTGFSDDKISQQDVPFIFVKKDAGPWTYKGDSGGNPCPSVPKELSKLWVLKCG
jgi:hypothetical protein